MLSWAACVWTVNVPKKFSTEKMVVAFQRSLSRKNHRCRKIESFKKISFLSPFLRIRENRAIHFFRFLFRSLGASGCWRLPRPTQAPAPLISTNPPLGIWFGSIHLLYWMKLMTYDLKYGGSNLPIDIPLREFEVRSQTWSNSDRITWW